MFPKIPDFIGFFAVQSRDFQMHIRRCKSARFPPDTDINSHTRVYLHKKQTSPSQKLVCLFYVFHSRSFLQKIPALLCYAVSFLRERSTTVSTCPVRGNISTGRTAPICQPRISKRARSLARVEGSQET